MRCVARCLLSSVSSDLGVSVPVRVCVYLMHDAVSRPVVSVRLTQLCAEAVSIPLVSACYARVLYYDLARVHDVKKATRVETVVAAMSILSKRDTY